ncbi:hypothetical protein [Streptomyces scopuliridis]|uniref:Uncharacterized protein n=1 Tax=Streptomyces scopuliridis RB72 TaxID=1440053 RepID=A0A2T7TA00_9ACTN|nr:hypothetical protein [Streptomyces scopuliridis]PVE12004.1 hypothetical protein Y717_07195 [Streptomyces scopuliridis RB72]
MDDRKTPATDTVANTEDEDWVDRLVPGCVPRDFAEPTPELTERVACGLRRLTDEAK